jgi:conjugal transfer pilus assembly protein TraK
MISQRTRTVAGYLLAVAAHFTWLENEVAAQEATFELPALPATIANGQQSTSEPSGASDLEVRVYTAPKTAAEAIQRANEITTLPKPAEKPLLPPQSDKQPVQPFNMDQVLTNPRPPVRTQAPPMMSKDERERQERVYEQLTRPSDIVMEPGTVEIVQVSRDHPTRIVTPFATPAFTLAQGYDIRPRDGVLYVAVQDAASTQTIVITEQGSEELALFLTMVPKRVPPREITLRLPEHVDKPMAPRVRDFQADQRSVTSWVEELRQVYKALATGEIPDGFALKNTRPGDLVPNCKPQHGVSMTFAGGQTLSGIDLELMIGVAENPTKRSVELSELWCVTPEVAAVAFWPHTLLAPGQKTEVFVAVKPDQTLERQRQRPSLVGGQ